IILKILIMSLKSLFIFPCLFAFLAVFAQTPEIAHKSHSGNMTRFNGSHHGNPGLPDYPPSLYKVERVNDTTARLYYQQPYGAPFDRMIYNDEFWLNAHLNKDSIQNTNVSSEEIEFVGYENLDKKVTHQEKAK